MADGAAAQATPTRGRSLLEAARRLWLAIRAEPDEPSTAEASRVRSRIAFAAAGGTVRADAGELDVVPGEPSGEDCPICLAPLTECVRTPCGHLFHKPCLEQYFLVSREEGPGARARCPLCRASVHAPLVRRRGASRLGWPCSVASRPSPSRAAAHAAARAAGRRARRYRGPPVPTSRSPRPPHSRSRPRARAGCRSTWWPCRRAAAAATTIATTRSSCGDAPPAPRARPPGSLSRARAADSSRGLACSRARRARPARPQDLGGFDRPRMLYVMTSNDDRKTPARRVMWRLRAAQPMTVFLNFRSEAHVANGASQPWLDAGGWERDGDVASAVTSGFPNGPYSGPVFRRAFDAPGVVELPGSNNWEGTYLVFVQLPPSAGADGAGAEG
jgi:hypothetical protein